MKKILTVTGLIFLVSALIFSGCTDNQEVPEPETKTYIWTAKQVIDDLPVDLDWDDGFQLLYDTLEDGDTLIISDTVTNISYDSGEDTTALTFEWGEDNENNSYSPVFEGDLRSFLSSGSNVRITVTIKYVELSYGEYDLQMEIFEEQWEDLEYFLTDLAAGGTGLKPLPQSTILIV